MPSTVIRGYSYDRGKTELVITFVAGRRYIYQAVPSDVYDAFKAAFSKGSFFNHHIRDHYACRDVTGEGISG
jgi:hypothetical protein